MATVQRTRMRWYYEAMIDWMIANPGKPLHELAQHVGKTPSTVSIIINSDMFKAAYAARRASFQIQHDIGIVARTTQVATEALDAMLEQMRKKRDTLPMEMLKEISDSALDRLGYGTKSSSPQGVVVNVQQNTQIVAPVSRQDLEEARMALRVAQNQLGSAPPKAMPTLDTTPLVDLEILPQEVDATLSSDSD